jgi:ketosteroid isomerase-like protein
MSEANLAVVRRYVEVFDRGDVGLPIDDVDPDVTVDWSESNAPYAGIYSGHQGWRRLFGEIRQSFQDARVEVHDYVVTGPHIAIHNNTHMRGRDGIAVEATSTMVFTFSDDKIVAVRLFQKHADALKAMAAG